MKNVWLLRMRRAIVSVEQKHARDVEFVNAHEAHGGDPKDRTYENTKFIISEMEKQCVTMAVDTEEGNVSVFENPQRAVLRLSRAS